MEHETLKRLPIFLPKETLEILKAEKKKTGNSVSSLIRLCIHAKLSEKGEDET